MRLQELQNCLLKNKRDFVVYVELYIDRDIRSIA